MNRPLGALLISIALASLPLWALSNPDEWSHHQPLTVAQPGMVRWAVPPETLNHAAPDRQDLRLFDPHHQEVPYLLDEPRREEEKWSKGDNFKSEIEDTQTVLRFSLIPGSVVNAVSLAGPVGPFLKGVQVEAQVSGAWKTLARNQVLFRETPGVENLTIEFPSVRATSFIIKIDDKKSPAVPWTRAAVRLLGRPAEGAQTVPLRFLGREEGPTETRLRLELPGRNIFIEDLSVESQSPLFQRSVSLRVRGVRTDGDFPGQAIKEWPLAAGTFYRVALEGFENTKKTDLRVGHLVRAREVVLVIQNNGNPPIPIDTVHATVLPTYLIFRGSAPGTYRLALGNPRAAAPIYDLVSLKPELIKGPFQSAGSGPLEPNPTFQTIDILPELPEWGASLDVSPWARRSPVSVSKSGFHRVELTPTLLAVADPSGRDLRLIREGKQIPFLLDRTPVWRSTVPTVKPLKEENGKSRWELLLPQNRMPVGAIECFVKETIFQRKVTVYETKADPRGQSQKAILAQTEWGRTANEGTGRRFLFIQGGPMGDRLVIEVDNGDNAPLTLNGFKIHYQTFGIVFKTDPGSPLWLYYGNPQANWPRYDLSVVSQNVLTADREEASLGEEERLRGLPWSTEKRNSAHKIGFWFLLGFVAIILLWVLRSLLPTNESKPSPPRH